MKRSAPYRKIISRGALLFMVCAAAFLSACLPIPATLEAQATPTASPTITLSPTTTGTIIWFPPTPTFTPFATRQILPTQDMHPAVGEILLEDDFSKSEVWQVSRTAAGSTAYGQGDLTLAISSPRSMVTSLRSTPQLTDFYMEIDAFPTLCRSADAYGLMLRAESQANYYRVWFNCSGQIRVERIQENRVTPLQDWTSSGQVAAGALLKTRLGVWAARDELRIFANDVYQFSIRDPLYRSGQIGVMARSAGETPLTVSFSNLVVRSVEASRVPTPVPTPTITVPATATRLPTATNIP